MGEAPTTRRSPAAPGRRLVSVVGLGLLLAAVLTNLPGAVGSSWAQPLFQALLWIGVLAVLFVEARSGAQADGPSGRAIHQALALLALFAVVSHVHFGRFHGDGRYLHHHELYSNGLGSKYFEELGYDGLYLATHRALIENDNSLQGRVSVVKNLHTYQLESASIDLQRSDSVAARFTEQRWRDFKQDVRFFQTVIPPEGWQFLLVDHGYNTTPFWTSLASVFTAHIELGKGTLALFVSLDLLLIAALLLFVRSAFGLRICLLFAVFFFANALSTFDFTGGALLRQVWFVCLVGFVGFYKQGRMALAGFLLGIATLDRAFPLVFALLPAVQFVQQTVSRRSLRHGPARLLVALGVTLVGLGALSATATIGLDAWTDWYANISSHNRWFFINQISLRNLFIVNPLSSFDIIGAGWDESRWLREREALDALTGKTLLVVRGILCALLALVMTRRRDAVASLAWLAFLPFVLFYTADYYYVFLSIVVLAWRSAPRLATIVLGLQIPFWLLRIALPSPLHLELLHWIVSLCLAATLVSLLYTELRRGAREHPVFRRAAAATLGLGAVLLIAAIGIDRRPAPEGAVVVLDLSSRDVRSVHAATAGSQQLTRWGNGWSRNDHLAILTEGVGSGVTLDVPARANTAYRMRIHYSTAPSFGVVQPSVNGVEIGEPVNLYSPRLGVLAVVHDEIALLEGSNEVSFEVVGNDPASTEHHFAIDTIVLEPDATSRDRRLDRALAWVAAHPADRFDGGRQTVGAEIATLYSLWSNPHLTARRPVLRSEIEQRLRWLDSFEGDWVLPSESGALLVAAHVARQLDLASGGSQWLAGSVRQATTLSNTEGPGLLPLVFCESLRRLDPTGEPACRHQQSALYQESITGSLLSALSGPVDRAVAPAISAALRSIVQDVLALTDQGRQPLPTTELIGRTDWLGPLCEQGLRWGRQTGDVLLVARLVLLAKLTAVEPSVPSLPAALDDLRRWQEADGSFGVTNPYSANPKRDGVLAAILALAWSAD